MQAKILKFIRSYLKCMSHDACFYYIVLSYCDILFQEFMCFLLIHHHWVSTITVTNVHYDNTSSVVWVAVCKSRCVSWCDTSVHSLHSNQLSWWRESSELDLHNYHLQLFISLSQRLDFQSGVYHPLIDYYTGELETKREFQRWR